jgi:Na+-driven multidrug efflux pump
MACSLLADSLAVAAQALLAANLAAGDPGRARRLAMRVLKLSLGLGGAVGLVLMGFRHAIAKVFTTRPPRPSRRTLWCCCSSAVGAC